MSEGGIFGLGRPIDFTDGITRIALICTILTSVAATFWKTMGGADTKPHILGSIRLLRFSFQLIARSLIRSHSWVVLLARLSIVAADSGRR
ncbi:MAG: hypothetical protein ACLR2G_05765 [Phascolarctobacterium faecium]